MATVRDLITRSAKLMGVVGAGETLSNEDATDLFDALNGMISAFSVEKFVVYQTKIAQSATLTSETLTIGTGGDINITRPSFIERATYVLNNIEYQIEIIDASRYSEISYKQNIGGIPSVVYFDGGFPLITAKLWPIPNGGTMKLYYRDKLSGYTSLSDTVSLPDGYDDMLVYNLTVRSAPMWEREASPTVVAEAARLKYMLKEQNNQYQKMVVNIASELGTMRGFSSRDLDGLAI